MRTVLLLTTLMATMSVVAVERQELMPLIITASTAKSNAYLEVRNKIIGYGKDALPLLAELTKDEKLPWQQQLLAHICYERIHRKTDTEKLLATDWYKHPNYNRNWELSHTGPEAAMVQDLVTPALKEIGLWYYYLELGWKMTGEEGKISNWASDSFYWVRSCTLAVKDNPEERVWFLRVCSDLIADAPLTPFPWLNKLYNILLYEDKGKKDTAEVMEKYRAKYPPPPPNPTPVPSFLRPGAGGMIVPKPATGN